jgi:hypothetical protein
MLYPGGYVVKHLKIEQKINKCDECICGRWYYIGGDEEFVCEHPEIDVTKRDNVIIKEYALISRKKWPPIPKWCPLPDCEEENED